MSNETITLRRYAILRGWARWLAMSNDFIREQERIAKLRGNRFGIAVQDDLWALRWQRVEFKIRRANYAVGMYGLTGRATFDGKKWIHDTNDTIREGNRKSFDEHYRQKAHRALNLLRNANKLVCPHCHNEGWISDGGDGGYPCDCQELGIISLDNPETSSIET